MVLLRTSATIGYYRHSFAIIATPTVLWGPLRGPRSTVRMVLLRTSAITGYYRHLFAIAATPTVLWAPLRNPGVLSGWYCYGTSAVIGYYRHLFAIIATPPVLWRPLTQGRNNEAGSRPRFTMRGCRKCRRRLRKRGCEIAK